MASGLSGHGAPVPPTTRDVKGKYILSPKFVHGAWLATLRSQRGSRCFRRLILNGCSQRAARTIRYRVETGLLMDVPRLSARDAGPITPRLAPRSCSKRHRISSQASPIVSGYSGPDVHRQ